MKVGKKWTVFGWIFAAVYLGFVFFNDPDYKEDADKVRGKIDQFVQEVEAEVRNQQGTQYAQMGPGAYRIIAEWGKCDTKIVYEHIPSRGGWYATIPEEGVSVHLMTLAYDYGNVNVTQIVELLIFMLDMSGKSRVTGQEIFC